MRASNVHLPPTSLLAFFLNPGGVPCRGSTQYHEQSHMKCNAALLLICKIWLPCQEGQLLVQG